MVDDKPNGGVTRALAPVAGETNLDYRACIAAHQAEVAQRRQQELVEQSASVNSPGSRIRIWERLHQVGLPRSPSHRLVEVIAAQTGLTCEEVRDEQQLRASQIVAAAPSTT